MSGSRQFDVILQNSGTRPDVAKAFAEALAADRKSEKDGALAQLAQLKDSIDKLGEVLLELRFAVVMLCGLGPPLPCRVQRQATSNSLPT
jgi:hypothetical protein